MKRWHNLKLLILLTTILILAISTGCDKKPDNKMTRNRELSTMQAQATSLDYDNNQLITRKEINEVIVYFATENQEYLVPLTIPINSTDQGAKAAIQRLIVGPNDEFLRPVIHPSTKLKELYQKDDYVYLDMTEHFLKFADDSAGETAIISIMKTLEPFIKGQEVKILIEGQSIDKEIGIFNLSEPISLAKKEVSQPVMTLYFVEQNGIYLVPVEKEVNSADPVKAAILELIKGPDEKSGLIPTIWPGTKVLGIDIDGHIAQVNLSMEALGYGGGSAAENLFVKSLLLTLTEFPQVNTVQLLFEGEKLNLLPEGTEVDKPLTRPEYINYKN